jgi:hypothetical protein
MTRLFLPAEAIEVTLADDATPKRFKWRGHSYRVSHVTHRWRISREWWLQPIHREFYRLTTEDGLLVILYCDLHDQ